MVNNDLIGKTIKGYKILDTIGSGNFGAVYRAHQATIGREVAIKVILPAYANRPEFVRLFEIEAQLIARLEHPHIVPLFDFWREPNIAYLVMRLLPTNLRRILKQSGKIAPDVVVQMVDQLASALALFHQQGIVHRDIKPDNILLDQHHNVYLSDFGLAKVLWDKPEIIRDEEEGITGSPPYMAPEQIRGDEVTPQTDIYALGVIIYEILTGLHPFGGDSLSVIIAKHLHDPLPDITLHYELLPKGVNDIIQQATAKDPESRYGDVLELAKALRLTLLGQVDTLATAEVQLQPVNNPYKGLRSFEEADAGNFFGRETLVHQLLERLSEQNHPMRRFLAVVGPSGSGKSSLVKAGLLPSIRQGALHDSHQWFIASMVPGTQPLKELEAALLSIATEPIPNLSTRMAQDSNALVMISEQILTDPAHQFILFIDQFEEIFTLVQEEKERLHLMNLLRNAVLNPISRIHIIITLRADFYDRPLLYEDFGALIQARTFVVLPLNTAELERAIKSPAERMNVQIDSNLVSAIIADVREEPGALPLLQYTLTELFERREGRTMTMRAYKELGGVAGAVAQRAEEVFKELSPLQKQIARQIFLRMVTLGEGTEDIRRRALRHELISVVENMAELQNVLDTFSKYRLLSFDNEPVTREPTVEVAHEALIRVWNRLRIWLAESRVDIRQQRRLNELTTEWEHAHHDPSYLLHGLQLQQFEEWRTHSSVALTASEYAFLRQSVAVREEEVAKQLADAERRAALEQRAARFRNGLLVAVSVGFVMALILSGLAFNQREEALSARLDAEKNAQMSQTQAAVADNAAQVAERRANSLQSLSLAEQGEDFIGSNQFDLGLALLLEANRIPDAPVRSRQLLFTNAPRSAVRIFTGHSDQVNAVALSPDGTRIISGGDDRTVILWDTETGEVLETLRGHTGSVRTVLFLPDGKRALSGGNDSKMILWDLGTQEIIHTFEGHIDDILTMTLSPDGQKVATGSRDQTIILWDIETGETLATFGDPDKNVGHEDRITALAFSPDGLQIISGSADEKILVWDVATHHITAQLQGHQDVISDIALNMDGTQMLSTATDGKVILWDFVTRRPLYTRTQNDERVTSLAFSPDGEFFVTGAGSPFGAGNGESAISVWNTAEGEVVRRFFGHDFQITDIALSTDGKTIVSASADNTLRLWEFAPDIDFWNFQNDESIAHAALSADQQLLVTATTQKSLVVWHLDEQSAPARRGQEFGEGIHTGNINAIAISLDKTLLLTASDDRTLILWDLTTYQPLRTFNGHTNNVNSVIFSPDGKHAYSGSRDRSIIEWDVHTGELLRTFATDHTNSINTLALSPDGKHLLSGSDDRSLIVWDIASGERITRLQGHRSGITHIVFSVDGQFAFSAARDQSIIQWDLTTNEQVRQFIGHTDWVNTLSISPDNQTLLSGSRDRTIRIWNVASAETVYVFPSFDQSVVSVDFMGDIALAISQDGTMRLLPVNPSAFIDWMNANRYVYHITCQERVQFLLAPCE